MKRLLLLLVVLSLLGANAAHSATRKVKKAKAPVHVHGWIKTDRIYQGVQVKTPSRRAALWISEEGFHCLYIEGMLPGSNQVLRSEAGTSNMPLGKPVPGLAFDITGKGDQNVLVTTKQVVRLEQNRREPGRVFNRVIFDAGEGYVGKGMLLDHLETDPLPRGVDPERAYPIIRNGHFAGLLAWNRDGEMVFTEWPKAMGFYKDYSQKDHILLLHFNIKETKNSVSKLRKLRFDRSTNKFDGFEPDEEPVLEKRVATTR